MPRRGGRRTARDARRALGSPDPPPAAAGDRPVPSSASPGPGGRAVLRRRLAGAGLTRAIPAAGMLVIKRLRGRLPRPGSLFPSVAETGVDTS